MSPRVALTTYSVKPRGGVVHTLELAESLAAHGVDVSIVAMGEPDQGFFRPVDVPVHIVPAPARGETLEERVFSWIDAMTTGLDKIADDFDILHSQDCISARAAGRLRTAGHTFTTVRTVHHVDDFTTQALIDCQAAAIHEPDHVLVVSDLWRRQLVEDYKVDATIVANGVRADRFDQSKRDEAICEKLRARAGAGADTRHLFLTVGGIEPRKGTKYLIEAMGKIKATTSPEDRPVLAIIGGHSFQDYTQYREDALASCGPLGLDPGVDIVLLGTVEDDELPHWFQAADSFVFPSMNEGWGLVVLEAQAAGLPVITSDIDVFEEFLVDEENALMTAAGDADSLADGMTRVMNDTALAEKLAAAGPASAARFSWEATAAHHAELYAKFTASGSG